MRFAKDYVGVDYHNDGHSHIDAFSHVAYDGFFYNGTPEESVTAQGADAGAIDILRDGLVGRGVLLDVPRLRGIPWLEPGEDVFPEDLEAAEREQGDPRRAQATSCWCAPGTRAAAPSCRRGTRARPRPACIRPTASFLAERRVAALGSDGNNDTAPSTTEGVGFPIHVLALNAMGIHLLDYLQLEDLARQCEAVQRWEFLFAAAPLRLVRGTGSPLNPTAIF